MQGRSGREGGRCAANTRGPSGRRSGPGLRRRGAVEVDRSGRVAAFSAEGASALVGLRAATRALMVGAAGQTPTGRQDVKLRPIAGLLSPKRLLGHGDGGMGRWQ